MHGVQGAADRAVSLTRKVLLESVENSQVHDVQNDPRFQHRGVDLLWDKPGEKPVGIEVKGDRQGFRRKNYFFELVSNAERDTPGCFLYSEADVLAYVLLDARMVHLMDFKKVRQWFVPKAKEFPLKTTKTKTGAILYTTVGAIVPMKSVKKEIPEAVQIISVASVNSGPSAIPSSTLPQMVSPILEPVSEK
jgi:hypothetical protein